MAGYGAVSGTLSPMRRCTRRFRKTLSRRAFHDPRFPPLQAAELKHLAVSVSVLTAPTPLDYRDADDLISKLVPQHDGVILQRGRARAYVSTPGLGADSRTGSFFKRPVPQSRTATGYLAA